MLKIRIRGIAKEKAKKKKRKSIELSTKERNLQKAMNAEKEGKEGGG